ncbi:MAG: hypothetical protein Kow0047_24350 [Anaerolineae bacterium]
MEILRRHVSNAPEDQRWHDVTLDLTPWRGQAIRLTLRTEPGPAGDFTGDRAAWGMLWLMRGEPRP